MKLSIEELNKIISNDLLVGDLSDEQIIEFCEYANKKYRSGFPVVSDEDYDFIFLKELKKRNPEHHLLNSVEPEIYGFSEEKSLLPKPMLSIDKAYTYEEIIKWIKRTLKAADDLNFNYSSLKFRATPKLDGFAGMMTEKSSILAEMEKKAVT